MYKKVPWLAVQEFYKVIDTDKSENHYCTTVEAYLKCCISRSGLKSAVEKRKLVKGRWLIERVPKFLFIKKTGRTTDLRREYYWKW